MPLPVATRVIERAAGVCPAASQAKEGTAKSTNQSDLDNEMQEEAVSPPSSRLQEADADSPEFP